MEVEFQVARENFFDVITECMKSASGEDEQSLQKIEECFNNQIASSGEKKAALDQAFRDVVKYVIKNKGCAGDFFKVLNLAASTVSSELTSPSILFILLQDIFDCITLEKCEEMFTYLEGRVAMWQSETYYNAGKNYLLRMCNDLLRRLSRSKNTVFCGRIQLFLASLFPLSEKSGLNLMSQFNLDNITLFNTKPEDYERIRRQSIEDKDDGMEVEEGETDDQPNNIAIDYNLYRKIWSLQDYFRKPGQCYDKTAWKCFISYCDDVLGCFESFKLDDTKCHHHQKDVMMRVNNADVTDNDLSQRSRDDYVYFPKYLTSEKLLDLELSDSNFRRNMLIQMLITFQYLQAHVKFKSASQVLSEDQTTWIKQTTERVMKVLRETPPDGDKFADTVEHILAREENWNNWKNDGCPSFVKEPQPNKSTLGSSGSRKRNIGDDLKASGGKLIKMGNSELTHLWNINPDNMDACRNKQKNFLPNLEEFFKDAIEQMDPEAMIEDEYKLVKNPTFAWKSLRLLSRKSAHFFAQTPNRQKKKTISEYLEGMLDKLAKEMPSSQTEDAKSDEVDDSVEQESADSAIHEDQLDNKQDNEVEMQAKDDSSACVTQEHINELAKRLSGDWKKLGTELGFPEDDISDIEKDTEQKEAQANKMLSIWIENEGDKATVELLRNALKEIGEEVVATEVFGEGSEA